MGSDDDSSTSDGAELSIVDGGAFLPPKRYRALDPPCDYRIRMILPQTVSNTFANAYEPV